MVIFFWNCHLLVEHGCLSVVVGLPPHGNQFSHKIILYMHYGRLGHSRLQGRRPYTRSREPSECEVRCWVRKVFKVWIQWEMFSSKVDIFFLDTGKEMQFIDLGMAVREWCLAVTWERLRWSNVRRFKMRHFLWFNNNKYFPSIYNEIQVNKSSLTPGNYPSLPGFPETFYIVILWGYMSINSNYGMRHFCEIWNMEHL